MPTAATAARRIPVKPPTKASSKPMPKPIATKMDEGMRTHKPIRSVDLFAGGGGASEGIRLATGDAPSVAVNHDLDAIYMHTMNHPDTIHFKSDVFELSTYRAMKGRPKVVDLLWLSPDCRHHSRAKGGKPRDRKIRGLAWIGVKWAAEVAPRVICLENVPEFLSWGPLGKDKKPIKERAGETFHKFVSRLNKMGYQVDWKILNAADYGAPTSRKRLFLVARNDGEAITWPVPSHGPGRAHPYRTAAECIDWSIACPSIFTRKRDLAFATMRRIAHGIRRYVLECKRPFLVNLTHGVRVEDLAEPMKTVTSAHRGEKAAVSPILVRTDMTSDGHLRGIGDPNEPLRTVTSAGGHAVATPFLSPVKSWGGGGNEARSIEQPMRTTTTSKRGEHAVVTPTLAPLVVTTGHQSSDGGKMKSADEPLSTIVTKAEHLLIAPTLVTTRNGERKGQAPRVRSVDVPMTTVTSKGSQGAVSAAYIAKHNGGEHGHQATGQALEVPLHTIAGNVNKAVVAAHMTKMYGTSTGSDLNEPMPTVTSGGGRGGGHLGEVEALCDASSGLSPDQLARAREVARFLETYTDLRFPTGLVTLEIDGELFVIIDIGMRMLEPRELARAQGFADTYRLTGNKSQQIHRIGNSVCPPVVEALVRTQFGLFPRGNGDQLEALRRAA